MAGSRLVATPWGVKRDEPAGPGRAGAGRGGGLGMGEIGAHASSRARLARHAAAVTAKWRDSDLIWREITAPPRRAAAGGRVYAAF